MNRIQDIFRAIPSDRSPWNRVNTGEQSRQETQFIAWFQQVEVTLSLQ
ncbi:MAG: hypothetical protein AAFO87_03635 [Cyanobacteria bacterium J06607_6]